MDCIFKSKANVKQVQRMGCPDELSEVRYCNDDR